MNSLKRVIATSLVLTTSSCAVERVVSQEETRDPFALNTAIAKEIEDRKYEWSVDFTEGFAIGAAERCIQIAREKFYSIGNQHIEDDMLIQDIDEFDEGIKKSSAVGESNIIDLCSNAIARIRNTV